MRRDQRFFQLEDQWNVVHLPERPNGFAVFIIGDKSHYVDDKTSLWIQNYQRFQLLETLRDKGYTIVYSNLFGANWGSDQAVKMFQRLYHVILREEILNKHVHILAEGMGGITALKILEEMADHVRSVAMLSPCLDIKQHIAYEKENKLFYKRFLKEFSEANQIAEQDVNEFIDREYNLEKMQVDVPMKIWHATARVPYSVSHHSRRMECIRKEMSLPIQLALHLYEKRYSIGGSITSFFKNHEKWL